MTLCEHLQQQTAIFSFNIILLFYVKYLNVITMIHLIAPLVLNNKHSLILDSNKLMTYLFWSPMKTIQFTDVYL